MTLDADKIMDYTARNYESGIRKGDGMYSVVVRDDVGTGVAFGFIQFNQKLGSLAGLFREMYRLDSKVFDEIFGKYAKDMLNPAWVKTASLSSDEFVDMLERAGTWKPFQQAQRNMAKFTYFDPGAKALAKYGLKSERSHALAFDTAVQRGPSTVNTVLKLVAENFQPVPGMSASDREKAIMEKFAVESDKTARVGTINRRKKIFADPLLSDAVAAGSGLLLLLGVGAAWYFLRA